MTGKTRSRNFLPLESMGTERKSKSLQAMRKTVWLDVKWLLCVFIVSGGGVDSHGAM